MAKCKRTHRVVSDDEDASTFAITVQTSTSQASFLDIQEVPALAVNAAENTKCAIYNKCWKTDQRTPEEVLCQFFVHWLSNIDTHIYVSCTDWQMQTWSSDVYNHFKKPTIKKHAGGVIKYIFTCKHKL